LMIISFPNEKQLSGCPTFWRESTIFCVKIGLFRPVPNLLGPPAWSQLKLSW
jgi:hypothetical protein